MSFRRRPPVALKRKDAPTEPYSTPKRSLPFKDRPLKRSYVSESDAEEEGLEDVSITRLTAEEALILHDWDCFNELIEKHKETGMDAALAMQHVLPLSQQRALFEDDLPEGRIHALYVKNDFIKNGIAAALRALGTDPTINDPPCQRDKCKLYACLGSGDSGCSNCLLEGKECKPHETVALKKATEECHRAARELDDAADTIRQLTEARDDAVSRAIESERIIEALSRALDNAEAGPGMTADQVAALRRKHDRAVRDLEKANEQNKRAVTDREKALEQVAERDRTIEGLKAEVTAANAARDQAIAQSKVDVQNERDKIDEHNRKVAAERNQLLLERNQVLSFLQGRRPLPE